MTSLHNIPTVQPIWIHHRAIPTPRIDDFSFYDFEYLATQIQIWNFFDMSFQESGLAINKRGNK